MDDGAVIVKFYFHITKDEQLVRFKRREADPYKSWKISDEDWRNRRKWEEHNAAAEEMFDRTNPRLAHLGIWSPAITSGTRDWSCCGRSSGLSMGYRCRVCCGADVRGCHMEQTSAESQKRFGTARVFRIHQGTSDDRPAPCPPFFRQATANAPSCCSFPDGLSGSPGVTVRRSTTANAPWIKPSRSRPRRIFVGAANSYERALDGTSKTADAHFRLGLLYDGKSR